MRRDRDERGAVTLFVGLFMVVLVGVAAIVVDIGTQRVARADMQALADVVALDLARELDGRTVDQIGSLDALRDASVARNTSTVGATPEVTPTLWVVDPTTGDATAAGDDDVPNAVKVEARTTVDFAFGLAEAGSAARDAMAFASPHACLKLGSSALQVDDLLGTGVSLSAAEYHGLATASVVLSDLAANLSAGTVEELLSSQVTLEQFYVAVADSLDDNGESSAASLIRTSLLGVASAAAGLEPVTVGELLAIGPAGAAALAATVDALSLVTAGAYVATGENAVVIPVSAVMGDLTGITAEIFVVEAPKIACGGATAETGQLRLEVAGEVGVPLLTAELVTSLTVAHASGEISSVECEDGEASGLLVDLSAPALAVLSVDLDTVFGDVRLDGTEPAPGSGGTYTLSLPENYDTAYESPAGAGTLGIPHLDPSNLPTGLAIPSIIRPGVVATLNAVLDAVSSLVVGISDAVGLRLASADMYGVRTAQCLNPSLID
jgi:uncharacterized membrane protein